MPVDSSHKIASPLPPRKRAKTEEEKEQRRVERILRNRRAAHASREKKRRHVEFLENHVVDLESALQESAKATNKLKQIQDIIVSRLEALGGTVSDLDLAVPEVDFPKFSDLELSTDLSSSTKSEKASTSTCRSSTEDLDEDGVAEYDDEEDEELPRKKNVLNDKSKNRTIKQEKLNELPSPLSSDFSDVDEEKSTLTHFQLQQQQQQQPVDNYVSTPLSLPEDSIDFINPGSLKIESDENFLLGSSTLQIKHENDTEYIPTAPSGSINDFFNSYDISESNRLHHPAVMTDSSLHTTAGSIGFFSLIRGKSFVVGRRSSVGVYQLTCIAIR
ncbi:BA75_01152T0 [Komagataella pastoris]|uniref:BA75_01152T0 n=1 Tax=Komagataella pastoris TaxID=4922 RepID=A0A1B2J688_PICPA|nr:BA75_01152T0 [Komagataella pastoris]